jgi:hypothetical protein
LLNFTASLTRSSVCVVGDISTEAFVLFQIKEIEETDITYMIGVDSKSGMNFLIEKRSAAGQQERL